MDQSTYDKLDESTRNKLKVVVSDWAIRNEHEMAIWWFPPLSKDDYKTINLAIIFSSDIPKLHQEFLYRDWHQQWQQELSKEFAEPIRLHRCIISLDSVLEKHVREKGELIF